MDTATDTPPTAPVGGRPLTRVSGVDLPCQPEQPMLPFGPLPYDDETDRPISYGLTARARRVIAPASIPHLAVVDGGKDSDDPSDTRPARARALRRAGFHTEDIAAQLAVDELLVRAWVSGVTPKALRPRSRHLPATRVTHDAEQPAAGYASDRQRDLASIRTAAQSDARLSLLAHPQFAIGLGLAAAVVEFDNYAALLVFRNPTIAQRVMMWLEEHEPTACQHRRMVLKIGRAVAGDVARQRWSAALAVDATEIALARWQHAPTPDAVEMMVRIGDSVVAARLAGWCDALVSGPVEQEQQTSF
ncbi:MAG: hypothetical protein WD576_01755 [Nitriliruptoraceae bacterium]